jgi:hypothetical protein
VNVPYLCLPFSIKLAREGEGGRRGRRVREVGDGEEREECEGKGEKKRE